MKTLKIVICLILLISIFIGSSEAGLLPVPHQSGSKPGWCWASATQGIFGFYGQSYYQCSIADWAMAIKHNGPQYCCTPNPPNPINCYGEIFLDAAHSPTNKHILQDFSSTNSITTDTIPGPVPAVDVFNKMNLGRLINVNWSLLPKKEDSHSLVIVGFTGEDSNGIVWYNDPMSADGRWKSMSYDAFVEDPEDNYPHEWTYSIAVNNRQSPAVDININGSPGPHHNLPKGSTIGINASFFKNGYYNSVDIFFAIKYNGLLYFLDKYERWATSPSAWKQGSLPNMWNERILTIRTPTDRTSDVEIFVMFDKFVDNNMASPDHWYIDYATITTY